MHNNLDILNDTDYNLSLSTLVSCYYTFQPDNFYCLIIDSKYMNHVMLNSYFRPRIEKFILKMIICISLEYFGNGF